MHTSVCVYCWICLCLLLCDFKICTPSFTPKNRSYPVLGNWLPSVELRLRSVTPQTLAQIPSLHISPIVPPKRNSCFVLPGSNSRVVRLESAPCHGEVGLGQRRLKVSGASRNQGVLGRGLVDGVADPGVPAGLDVGGVVVVLGVVDPAGSQGQFLEVLVVFVSGAIGANEGSGLGVTCLLGSEAVTLRDEERRRWAYRCTVRGELRELCVSHASSFVGRARG